MLSKNNKLLIEFPINFEESEIKKFNIILNITESHELKVKIEEHEKKCNLELDEITEIDEKDEIINNLGKENENQRKEIENKNKIFEDDRNKNSELTKNENELIALRLIEDRKEKQKQISNLENEM